MYAATLSGKAITGRNLIQTPRSGSGQSQLPTVVDRPGTHKLAVYYSVAGGSLH